MESSSHIFTSPSFNRHPSTDIADIADRVVKQLHTANRFGDDDIFSFNDVDNPAHIVDDKVNTNNHTDIVNQNEDLDSNEDDEHEFEFPIVCGDSNSSPDVISDDQISNSLRYPVFDRSLLLEADLNFPATDSNPASETSTRPSLLKLLREARDLPSTSSSEAHDLEGVTPGSYCVWKPNTVPRGKHKHKKSNSISIGNTSKKWKVQNLLKRSYSDDNYSVGKDSPVVVFIPPISPDRKMKNENTNKIEKTGKAGSAMDGGVVFTKPEKNIPAYKSKVGNIRLPPYLPYRQDQVATFSNFNGSSTNLYRY